MEENESEDPKPICLVTHPEVPEAAIKLLETIFQVIICESKPPQRQEIFCKSKHVDAILWADSTCLNAAALNASGDNLKVVSTMTSNFDFIDTVEMQKRGILCGYTPGVSDEAVGDLAIGLMLAAARHLIDARREIECGRWEKGRMQWMLGHDIKGATVGFIGFGLVGQNISRRLKGFDVHKILYCEQGATGQLKTLETQVDLSELLVDSDIIFAVCALTNRTKNIVDHYAFSKMKKNCIFINVTDCEIIDQNALYKALLENRIAAAGLDTTSPMPLPFDHPLLQLPNCVITPHLGAATNKTRVNMAVLAAHNIIRGFQNEELYASVY